jgi:hypothetical protein
LPLTGALGRQDVGLWLQFIDFCLKTKASLSKVMPK